MLCTYCEQYSRNPSQKVDEVLKNKYSTSIESNGNLPLSKLPKKVSQSLEYNHGRLFESPVDYCKPYVTIQLVNVTDAICCSLVYKRQLQTALI